MVAAVMNCPTNWVKCHSHWLSQLVILYQKWIAMPGLQIIFRSWHVYNYYTCSIYKYVKWLIKLIFWLSWWIQCFTSNGKITSQQGPALDKVTTRQIGWTNRRFLCLTFKQKNILLVGISYDLVDDPKYAFDNWMVISSPRKCFGNVLFLLPEMACSSKVSQRTILFSVICCAGK